LLCRVKVRETACRLKVLETERLAMRWLTAEDAGFILQLVNEPAWKLYIGDFAVRTLEEARGYIEKGPVAMYARHGFGLYLVELRETGVPIGICGLIKREALEDVDLGFAMLQEFRRKGYAYEASQAVMGYGRLAFQLTRMVAVLSRNNEPSTRLLEKLGFRFERLVRLKPEADEVSLFAIGP
jgi:RimJ/RimL family protein N-acetyltransferase